MLGYVHEWGRQELFCLCVLGNVDELVHGVVYFFAFALYSSTPAILVPFALCVVSHDGWAVSKSPPLE